MKGPGWLVIYYAEGQSIWHEEFHINFFLNKKTKLVSNVT